MQLLIMQLLPDGVAAIEKDCKGSAAGSTVAARPRLRMEAGRNGIAACEGTVMSHLKLALSRLALGLACGAALSACVVAPARPYGYGYAPGGVIVADVAPPPPYVEVVQVVPYAGAVWINGYWGWRSGRHEWVGGRWEQPRPGYAWAPHRWVPHDGRWHLEGGAWFRR